MDMTSRKWIPNRKIAKLLVYGLLSAGALSGCAPTLTGTDGGLILSAPARDTEIHLQPGGSVLFNVSLRNGYGPVNTTYKLSTLEPTGIFVSFKPDTISPQHPSAIVSIGAAYNAGKGLRDFYIQAVNANGRGSLVQVKVRVD